MNKSLNIILLTHERELQRTTNTGAIALNIAGESVQRIMWERTKPNQHLLDLLANQKALLLYPTDESTNVELIDFGTIIIIDSTWQEAQKIFNKSPYLKSAPKAFLNTTTESSFTLRRNQIAGGLCTIECIIELYKIKGLTELAEKLTSAFEQFNKNSTLNASSNALIPCRQHR